MVKKLALIAALLCGAAAILMQSAQAGPDPEPEFIPQKTLLDYLGGKANFTLIDARSAEEYAAGHIWGARNVPFDADLASSSALPAERDAAVVVYCKSGVRAQALQQSMLALGYTNVRVLGPSQMMWADALPVFNCGAVEPSTSALVTADAKPVAGGK